MKSKVLFVYHSSEIGGGSYCLLNLLKAIDLYSFEPVVLLPQSGPLSKEIDDLCIKVTFLSGLTTVPYNNTLFSMDSLRRILLLVKTRKKFTTKLNEIKPDIVYLNTMMLHPFLKLSKRYGAKTIIHIREHWNENEHKVQRNYAIDNISKYADKIVAINKYSASMFNRVKNKLTVVYDWIDMEARRGGPTLSQMMGEEKKGLKVYLFTGGIQPVKGTIEVIKTFSDQILGIDRRLLILGADTELDKVGMKGMVKKILSSIGKKSYKQIAVERIKADSRIVCAPAVYELTDLMEQVDAVVSYFTIPHANLALAESIITGTPSIAASTPESQEYADGSPFAFLYEFGNMEDFAEKWKTIDNGLNLKKIKEIGNSNTVSTLFDPKHNAEVFNHVLTEII